MSGPTEVRRCSRCGQPLVTLVSDWKHSAWGAGTGTSTRDYRCQGCGAKFTIHPGMKLIGWVVAGVILLPIGIGIIPLLIAWNRTRTDGKNPLAPGEPPPHIRYRDGPPLRECSCGGVAVATAITRRTHNGLPQGVEIDYACEQCKKAFTIESAWGQAISLFGGALLIGVGFIVYSNATSPWSRYGWCAGLSAIGLVLIAQFVGRVRNRLAHPPKPDALLA